MFACAEYPETLLHEELDTYLERGWFRMGQTIFTTNFLNFNNQLFSAIWLRVELSRMVPDKTQQKLRKANDGFQGEIKKASLDIEKEALFANYKQGISFNTSSSLQHLLYGEASHNIYDTFEITIRDNGKLIAAGFFDLGTNSAAGIASFYDQAYRKYSLGKYLIYLKMEYCKQLGLRYFYPGYFVPGYPFFDYKLKMGGSALEFLNLRSQQWLPINDFSSYEVPLFAMREKLNKLHTLLLGSGIESKILNYEFYSVNLVPDLRGMDLFDFPVFLIFSDLNTDMLYPIVTYDVRDDLYHMMQCRSIWASDIKSEPNEFYATHLLKVEEVLVSSAIPETIVPQVLSCLKKNIFYRNLT